MTDRKLDWVPFYLNDWIGSRFVRSLTKGEVGVYIDLLVLLWQNDGFARWPDGSSMTIPEIARQIVRRGDTVRNVTAILDSFRKLKTIDQDESGTFYNEKSVQICMAQQKRRASSTAAINARWSACKADPANTSVLRPKYDRITDESNPYIRLKDKEERNQRTEGADAPPYDAIVALYHELCPTMPQCRKLTDKRRKQLKARWKDGPEYSNLDWWKEYFSFCNLSTFLRGEGESYDGRPIFCADIEWLTNASNMVKILEGKYHRASQPRMSKRTMTNAETLEWARNNDI